MCGRGNRLWGPAHLHRGGGEDGGMRMSARRGDSTTTLKTAEPAAEVRSRRVNRADAVTVLCYLGLAVAVMWPLWVDPTGVRLVDSLEDTYFNEWNLAYAAHVLTDGANPLFT